MEIGLFQMKHRDSFAGFISTSYIGEIVKNSPETITLSKVCALYEIPVQRAAADGKPYMDIESKFYSNSSLTNGEIELKNDCILLQRFVEEGDELLKGYNAAIEAMRLHRAGLSTTGKKPELSM